MDLVSPTSKVAERSGSTARKHRAGSSSGTVVERLEGSEHGHVLLDDVGELPEELATLRAGNLGPGGQGSLGRSDGSVDIVLVSFLNLRDNLILKKRRDDRRGRLADLRACQAQAPSITNLAVSGVNGGELKRKEKGKGQDWVKIGRNPRTSRSLALDAVETPIPALLPLQSLQLTVFPFFAFTNSLLMKR